MVEKSHSITIVANLILLAGVLYILAPLYLTVTTASQSYECRLTNGLAWVPGDRLIDNLVRAATQTRLPWQMLNSVIVAFGSALAICVLSFISAFAIVYFKQRWAGIAFAFILASIMLPLDVRVITTYQVADNLLAPINGLLDITGLN